MRSFVLNFDSFFSSNCPFMAAVGEKEEITMCTYSYTTAKEFQLCYYEPPHLEFAFVFISI